MKASILCFSDRGELVAGKSARILRAGGFHVQWQRCPQGGLFDWARGAFADSRLILFVSSVGIAVRASAPFLKSKVIDPAVLAVDESASFVVSVLSGHLGGANVWTEKLAGALGAVAVITTATDRRGLFAADEWSRANRFCILDPERIKPFSAALLAGKTLRVYSDFPVRGAFPEQLVRTIHEEEADLHLSWRQTSVSALRVIVPSVFLGLGARRGVSGEEVEEAVALLLKESGCHPLALKAVGSIDLKKHEEGILDFCRRKNLPFHTFSAETLSAQEGNFHHSDFVYRVCGVDNVCERSAIALGDSVLLYPRMSRGNVTGALALEQREIRFQEGEEDE